MHRSRQADPAVSVQLGGMSDREIVLRLVREAIRYFQTNRVRRISPSAPAASRYREEGSGTESVAPLTGNEIPLAVVTETPEIGAPVVGSVTSTLTIDAGSRKSAVTVLPALAWASRAISCSNWYCVPCRSSKVRTLRLSVADPPAARYHDDAGPGPPASTWNSEATQRQREGRSDCQTRDCPQSASRCRRPSVPVMQTADSLLCPDGAN